eukprot:GILJ01008151.1.p1 GENE.GILJ01008151.1~~GILJ01008151.1.p1  ORF type:complete len:522 (-),score=59.86 GILJ01008151.1:176-1741(-)
MSLRSGLCWCRLCLFLFGRPLIQNTANSLNDWLYCSDEEELFSVMPPWQSKRINTSESDSVPPHRKKAKLDLKSLLIESENKHVQFDPKSFDRTKLEQLSDSDEDLLAISKTFTEEPGTQQRILLFSRPAKMMELISLDTLRHYKAMHITITDAQTAKQAVCDGLLLKQLSHSPTVPETWPEWLFNLVALSVDVDVSLAAFRTLERIITGVANPPNLPVEAPFNFYSPVETVRDSVRRVNITAANALKAFNCLGMAFDFDILIQEGKTSTMAAPPDLRVMPEDFFPLDNIKVLLQLMRLLAESRSWTLDDIRTAVFALAVISIDSRFQTELYAYVQSTICAVIEVIDGAEWESTCMLTWPNQLISIASTLIIEEEKLGPLAQMIMVFDVPFVRVEQLQAATSFIVLCRLVKPTEETETVRFSGSALVDVIASIKLVMPIEDDWIMNFSRCLYRCVTRQLQWDTKSLQELTTRISAIRSSVRGFSSAYNKARELLEVVVDHCNFMTSIPRDEAHHLTSSITN